MLKAGVPKGKGPGDKFDVKVPAPIVSDEGDKNKFSREFQELTAQFSFKYDMWCHAEGTQTAGRCDCYTYSFCFVASEPFHLPAEYHSLDPEQKGKFPLKNKKVSKFEEVIKAFPSNLVTPVDEVYMKKIVRRARQNKKKRKEATDDDVAVASIAAKPAATKPDSKPSPKAKPTMKLDVKSLPKATKNTLLKAVKPVKPDPKPDASKTIDILLPTTGHLFPQHELRHEEFEGMTKDQN